MKKLILILSLLLCFTLPSSARMIIGSGATPSAGVSRTGSVTDNHTSANTGTLSVTAPADATYIVVGCSGYGVANYFSTGTLTYGGDALAVISDYDNAMGVTMGAVLWGLKAPKTGAQDLVWDWAGTGTLGQGGHIHIGFYKGVYQTTPIKSEGGMWNGSTATSTTGSLTAVTGDMFVGIASADGTVNLVWTNATEVDDNTFNSDSGSYAEGAPTGNVTVSVTRGTSTHITIAGVILDAE
jgi:hypothetical protein